MTPPKPWKHPRKVNSDRKYDKSTLTRDPVFVLLLNNSQYALGRLRRQDQTARTGGLARFW